MRVIRIAILLIAFSLTAKVSEATPFTLAFQLSIAPGGPNLGYGVDFRQMAVNNWPASPGGISLFFTEGIIGGGVHVLYVAIDVPDFSQLYFREYATFPTPFSGAENQFGVSVAEPPGGHVSDGAAFQTGGPYISLAALQFGPVSADQYVVFGPTYAGSDHVGSWQVSVTPEPGTILLLGTGLVVAAIGRKRLNRRKRIGGEADSGQHR